MSLFLSTGMHPTFDIGRARKETRYCDEIIHFNNAGSALVPIPVAEQLHAYLHQEERMGGYETAAQQHALLDHFYHAAASLLNCNAAEIAFIENATRAWDMAFYSFKFAPGDKILTTLSEYGSNIIAYNQQAERYGVDVVFVPNDEHGQVDVQALANLLDERVKLIALSHIPTGSGMVQPVQQVGALARAAGVPFLLDACQSMGQLPVDVQAIGCDIASGTGRKFLRGPRGTGLLYVRQALLEQLTPPFLDIHAAALTTPTTYEIRPDAKRFENWEQYFAGKAALGTAISYALSYGIEAIQARVYHLAALLRKCLSALDGVTVLDEGVEQCGIVTFSAVTHPPSTIKTQLAAHQINVSVAASNGGNFVHYAHRDLDGAVRASVHYYNTEQEIARFIDVLRTCLSSAPQ